jgi:hypothetical protein
MTRYLLIAAFSAILQPALAAANDAFDFSPAGNPPQVSRPGMFIGMAGGAVLAGGGLDEAGKPAADYHASVAGSGTWSGFQLESPIAFAGHATVELTRVTGKQSALLLVGGIGPNGITDEVRLIEWSGGQPKVASLPPLPLAVAMPGVGFFGDQKEAHLWVIGGTTSMQADSASSRVFRLSLDKPDAWQEMPPLPGAPVLMPGVACFYNDVHVFGGFEVAGPGSYQPITQARAAGDPDRTGPCGACRWHHPVPQRHVVSPSFF